MKQPSLETPDVTPWSDRKYPESGGDPRLSYHRDRDRILHCESFRKLQHKTQVFIVHEGDFFRTRITHSLEVAQIGRGIAWLLGLSESLTEAICLAHDLGHAPFGHAGEYALNELLEDGWNSNAYSLDIVEKLELQYCERRGLNLTWAVREGIARHETEHDVPSVVSEYATYKQSSLEAQITNIADTIAVNTHDVEDALVAGILKVDDLHDLGIEFWERSRRLADREFKKAHPEGIWLGVDKEQLLNKRTRRHMINQLIRDVCKEYKNRLKQSKVQTVEEVRALDQPLVVLSKEMEAQVAKLSKFMMGTVYKGPLVARQNFKAIHILTSLYNAFLDEAWIKLLPPDVQERVKERKDKKQDWSIEIARFLARLTDRGASDLYAELFEPTERAMGHHIV